MEEQDRDNTYINHYRVDEYNCGYGLGVMISASQADDSGSIPGSRIIFHIYFEYLIMHKTRYNWHHTIQFFSSFIFKSLR
jgi:hypothetical protein